jgi:hypothetical protein
MQIVNGAVTYKKPLPEDILNTNRIKTDAHCTGRLKPVLRIQIRIRRIHMF